MMGTVEWVNRFCDTMEDATSLRIMRGRAYQDAYGAIDLLNKLPRNDPWIPELKVERDQALDCINRIEARLTALGLENTWGDERSYGLDQTKCRHVDRERKKHNGKLV